MSAVVPNNRHFHGTDEPYALANDAPEWERLDDQHKGINDYLEKKLLLAPIKNPKKILEVGSGSGAWAIQAAQTYPEAEVLAIDIAPLPPRPLPSNLKYKNLNVTQPLPLDPASFDVVHARFVLVHLPEFPEVLKRIIQLVKPGGFLLIEDNEHRVFGDIGPGTTRFFEVYNGYMKSRGADPMTGPKLEPLLRESGAFREVFSHKIEAPVSGKTDDPNLAVLGEIMKISLLRAFRDVEPRMVTFGMTQEVQNNLFRELEDNSRNLYVHIHVTWAQKRE